MQSSGMHPVQAEMTFFLIATEDGVRSVDGRGFTFEVDETEFQFFIHQDGPWAKISEVSTGRKVEQLATRQLVAHQGDEMAAARAQLKLLIERVGAAHLRQVIEQMPKIREIEKASRARPALAVVK